jgi:RNA polymerase sigma-70 factor (ECF subfamily)
MQGPLDIADPGAFAALYERHSRGVYATAFKVLGRAGEAEDVTQEVFLRLWLHPDRFDPERGELGSYLRLMARSRALDLWRKEQAAGRARDRLELVASTDEAVPDDLPAAEAERRETRAAVRAALRKLPTEQREALVLAYWGGLTAAQVAERSKVPFGTARSRIRLGMGKLRKQFDGFEDDPTPRAA